MCNLFAKYFDSVYNPSVQPNLEVIWDPFASQMEETDTDMEFNATEVELALKGFDKNKIVVFNDVRDAYPYISNLALNEEVYALFENDLPDTYNE